MLILMEEEASDSNLGRENVASSPADRAAEGNQGLDEDGRLGVDVTAAHDLRALGSNR